MFNRQDIQGIDKSYFTVISVTAYYIELKSKNTKHIWIIYSRMLFWGKRSLIVYHKHRESDPPHIQLKFHPRNICEAQILIKNHDEWQLNGRK